MHYADGTEAKLGDVVRQTLKEGLSGQEVIGILVSATASCTTCNGQIQPLARRVVSTVGKTAWMPYTQAWDVTVTIGECLPLGI